MSTTLFSTVLIKTFLTVQHSESRQTVGYTIFLCAIFCDRPGTDVVEQRCVDLSFTLYAMLTIRAAERLKSPRYKSQFAPLPSIPN